MSEHRAYMAMESRRYVGHEKDDRMRASCENHRLYEEEGWEKPHWKDQQQLPVALCKDAYHQV
jgi:hypothetical protein